MKKTILILFTLFLIISNINAQHVSRKEFRFKPKDINESLIQLKKIHNDSIKNKIRNMSENEFLSNSHLGLGMWIRNNWKLWKGGELSNYFNELGIYHPDNMSGIILTSYYRDLTEKPIQLNEQIEFYKKYWKDLREHKQKMESDSIYVKKFKQNQLNAEINYWNSLRKNFKLNEFVTTYLTNSCGFFGSYKKSKVKGKIVDLGIKKSIQIEIIEILDLRKERKIRKCNEIVDNKIWVNLESVTEL